LNITQYGVRTIGDMPAGLPSFDVPFWQYMRPMISQERPDMHAVVSAAANLEAIFRLIGPGIINSRHRFSWRRWLLLKPLLKRQSSL